MRVPAFVDTHFHLSWTARSNIELNLKEVKTVKEVLEKVKEEDERGGTYGGWIIGSLLYFKIGRSLNRWLLDEVTSLPTSIATRDGHMAIANSKAIEIANVKCGHPGVECEEGVPTGRFFDDAMLLLRSKMPDPPVKKLYQAYRKVLDELYRNGFLQIHAMTSRWFEWEIVKKMGHKVEVIPYMRSDSFVRGAPGVKLFVDGVFLYGTAMVNGKGRLMTPKEEIVKWLKRAEEENFKVALHVMGDEALDLVIEAYEEAGKPKGRMRIEHAAVTRDDQLEYLAEEEIPVSVQPGIVDSVGLEDMKALLGPLWNRFMRVKDMMEYGVKVYHGSDSPVGPWRLKDVLKYYKALSKPLDLEEVVKLMSTGWEIHGGEPRAYVEVLDDGEVIVGDELARKAER
ncbi:hypothetical protein IPA_06495 [Ignicoccus pacificus DSM 13166]|uniref:Amidohydrolase 3 domain-containing protein n=1 Tax=Ignicoccus pacificus DSM 13166 TaxID=940294 RepID=A0A977PLK1_9CREN|nr:hypothetical protein IPA_06495 [Ignicoccus pacificus DSM 13166]